MKDITVVPSLTLKKINSSMVNVDQKENILLHDKISKYKKKIRR
jgi:hypothetical protein